MIDEELPTLEGEYTVLLGMPFLRAYYTIYDMDDNRFGLVPLRPEAHKFQEEQAKID